MNERLPYRLPATSSGGAEALFSLLLAFVGASWLVTERFAARFAFDPRLGEPWLRVPPWGAVAWVVVALAALVIAAALVRKPSAPVPWVLATLALPALAALAWGTVYQPFAWIAWRADLMKAAAHQPALAPLLETLHRDLGAFLGGAALAALLRAVATGSRKGDTQGSARFATRREVGALGLRKRATGVVIGGEMRFGRYHLLHAPDRRHVGIFGPSGCGKTTKVIIPTLFAESASMVVLDIKMELYAITAEHRRDALGQRVFAFAPSVQEPWVAGYNPLLDIPKGPYEVAYAQAVALALVDPDGQIKSPDFWQSSARALLTAAILHTLYAGKDVSLAGVQALLAAPGKTVKNLLLGMQTAKHDPSQEWGWVDPVHGGDTSTHPAVMLETSNLIELAEETLTGILATARSKLALFLDPVIATNTRRHTFSLAELGNPAKPTTVYLIIPARDIARLSGLLRLFLQLLSFHLTASLAAESKDGQVKPAAKTDRNLVILLDELAAVGRLDLVGRQIAYLRGYGIQVVAAVQTANQLYEVYGQYESLRGNLAYFLAFPSTEQKTAEEISKLLGDQTIEVESTSRSSGETFLTTKRSVSKRDHKRPLLTADEVRRLKNENPILFVTGAYPVWNFMRGWWEVGSWLRRGGPASPKG